MGVSTREANDELLSMVGVLSHLHHGGVDRWGNHGAIQASRATRADDVPRLAAIMADVEWIGLRIFTPSTLVLLGSGIWMVVQSNAWSFTQLWI